MVQQVGQNEAQILLLAREGLVVVAVVLLLVPQGEGGGQSVQLGGDVGLQEVLALSPLSLQTAACVVLQELLEGRFEVASACHNNIHLFLRFIYLKYIETVRMLCISVFSTCTNFQHQSISSRGGFFLLMPPSTLRSDTFCSLLYFIMVSSQVVTHQR